MMKLKIQNLSFYSMLNFAIFSQHSIPQSASPNILNSIPMYYPLYYDPTFLIIIPALIITFYAQYKVKRTVAKYQKIPNNRHMTGSEIAKEILQREGLSHIPVEKASGFLSDHYDPIKKVLRLSPEVYANHSVAAIGIAAHEVGHALQQARHYYPLMLRTGFYPVANIGSRLAPFLIILGFIFTIKPLILGGIIFFAASVFFTVMTLPVEFNASKRAMVTIRQYGFTSGQETQGVKKVLNAAAMTYVAAALVAVMQLVRFILIYARRD